MGKMTLTKQEAVEQFGSEKCKVHFAKYKKFKNKSIEESLEKTLEQNFVSVMKIKVGRSYVYEVGDKKETITSRVDKRINNGSWSQVTHEFDMNILIELFNQCDNNSNSYQVWLNKLALLGNEMMFFNNLRYNDDVFQTFEEDVIKQSIIFPSEKKVFVDIWGWIDKLKEMLISSCNRLVKIGLLRSMPSFYGFKLRGYSKIELKEETFGIIQNKRKELLEYFGVTLWYVKTYKHSAKSKNFLEAWEDYLKTALLEIEGEDIPLQNVFIEHSFDLRSNKNLADAIDKYVQFYSLKEYMDLEWNDDLAIQVKLKAEESILLTRHNYDAKITKSVLKYYKENLERSAIANGFEDLQDVLEEWIKPQLTSFEQKYMEHHFVGNYSNWISNIEEEFIQLIKFDYLKIEQETSLDNFSDSDELVFGDIELEKLSKEVLIDCNCDKNNHENDSVITVSNFNQNLGDESRDDYEGNIFTEELLEVASDTSDPLDSLRKYRHKSTEKALINVAEITKEERESFLAEIEQTDDIVSVKKDEKIEPSEYDKIMMYEYFKECKKNYMEID